MEIDKKSTYLKKINFEKQNIIEFCSTYLNVRCYLMLLDDISNENIG